MRFALVTLLLFTVVPSLANATPRFKRVLAIVFENTDYEHAIAQPDFARIAAQGALLTNFSAETHPSQGNYIALIAGDDYGVHSDKPVNLAGRHLGDLLEEAHLSWRVYAEDFPGNCYTGSSKGNYARKHVPFVSFTNVTGDPTRCAYIQGSGSFDQDLGAGNLPTFSLYIPNVKNDGHDTGVSFAGRWVTKKFGGLFSDPNFMRDTLVVLTFDENEGKTGNRVYTVLLGGAVRPGSKSNTALSHVSLLRLIEDELRLGSLGKGDASSNAIDGIWN